MPQPFTSAVSRKPRNFAPAGAPRHSGRRPPAARGGKSEADNAEHEILFQSYFKSVGPRTYAAQVKRANNDNHYLVLTEGKRDEKTGEVRKARLFLYSEDFVSFFRMLQETAQFIRANPVPEEVKQKRDRYWTRKGKEGGEPPQRAASAGAGTAASAKPSCPNPAVRPSPTRLRSARDPSAAGCFRDARQ